MASLLGWYSNLSLMLPARLFPQAQNFVKDILLPALIILAVIVAGLATGWGLSSRDLIGAGQKGVGKIEPGREIGSKDEQTFRDKAEGVLEEGGTGGEGTHHLVRSGGPSQNVYLTSSVIDLDELVGKKVEVWGETFKGEKAGWLMDVGRIKVLE